jgi:hypothetical protein
LIVVVPAVGAVVLEGAAPQAVQASAPRSYEQVVTDATTTDDGIFKVHRLGSRLFYEIPQAELGKDFLWNTQIKKASDNAWYGKQVGSRVVRWIRKGDQIWLLDINYSRVADASTPIAPAVDAATYPVVISVFPAAAYSSASDPVIDVTPLFMTDVPRFSPRVRIGARALDPARSIIEKAVSFPTNINVEVTQTFLTGTDPVVSSTVLTHHSMLKLPEQPMMPRMFDERVGYFSQGVLDFGTDEPRAVRKRLITRWRLEKRDPSAAISEPVRPIVYYIDPATPTRWVPYIKQGVEDWQPAFEAAGFKNAIVARDAPADDPDWSPEDARYSVIRWLPTTDGGAGGPHVHDPRTGEILEADIQFSHNAQLGWLNHFLKIGPLDPRAGTLPLADDLTGRSLRWTASHEVGHTLGLRHNMKAGSGYTIAQIRDAVWVKEMGHTPTVMDYSRYNYVAQPEDGIDPRDLVARIGPYDTWAIVWGYKPIPDARTPDAELAALESWTRELDQKPYLRFLPENDGADPGNATWGVGNADPVTASRLGLKNLARVSDVLLPAIATLVGERRALLEEMHGFMLRHWSQQMTAVVLVVGGVATELRPLAEGGPRFAVAARGKQAEAVQFLLQHAFQLPKELIRPEILRQFDHTVVVERARTAQLAIMAELLQSRRLDRLAEQAALDGPNAYAPVQFLGDLRKGLWSELGTPGTSIDIYRRNVQRSYLDTIDDRLNGAVEPGAEVRALLRGELHALAPEIEAALPRVTDEAARRHLQDCRDLIARILHPRPTGRAGTGGSR